MSWVIPFIRAYELGVFFIFTLCTFFSAFLRLVLTSSYFQIQCTIEEHKKLVWLVGDLKLEVTEYFKQIYGPDGYAQLGDDDDDDDLEVTLSTQLRKGHYRR